MSQGRVESIHLAAAAEGQALSTAVACVLTSWKVA
jgi:hypothetical protein